MAGVRLFWTTKRWIVQGASLSDELPLSTSDLSWINVLKDRERDRPARSVGLLKFPMNSAEPVRFSPSVGTLVQKTGDVSSVLFRGTPDPFVLADISAGVLDAPLVDPGLEAIGA